MKRLFQKMGFRRADEMEMSIQLKAIRRAWLYSISFLCIWSIWEAVNTGEAGLPLILLLSQNIVLISFVLYYRRKAGGNLQGDDDEE